MLWLYRCEHEEVILRVPGHPDIRVKLLRVGDHSALLGFEAPLDVLCVSSRVERHNQEGPC